MPIHDWTKVKPGTFHAFHAAWIIAIQSALNAGVLPRELYALAEQRAGDFIPDVLTLSRSGEDLADDRESRTWLGSAGSVHEDVALVTEPPQTLMAASVDRPDWYTHKQNRIAIRHVEGDHVVAAIEIVSPSNKHSRVATDSFVRKSTELLARNVHLTVIDLFAPRPFDPRGLVGEIWADTGGEYSAKPDAPLTLGAFACDDERIDAFIQPACVGDPLFPIPVFITARRHIRLPLEETYSRAFSSMPMQFQSRVASKSA